MKNIILIILSIAIFSCNDKNKIKALNSRISKLEKENKTLVDSINRMEVNKIMNSELIMIPQETILKLNQVNKLTGFLVEHQKFKNFNIYKRDTTLYTKEPRRELILKNYSDYKFEVDFVPKSKKDNWLHILAEFDLDSMTVKIPGIIVMDAK